MDARVKPAHDECVEPSMKFFSFWRSLASFRVRIALNLKNVPAEVIFVDLDANAHREAEYRKVNPQMALPALVEDDDTTLFQSLAILEYLNEKYPSPPLLPADINGRARVRALALMVACEGHPLLVPRVRRYLDHELNLRDTQQTAWRRHWTVETLAALEVHLASRQILMQTVAELMGERHDVAEPFGEVHEDVGMHARHRARGEGAAAFALSKFSVDPLLVEFQRLGIRSRSPSRPD